MDLKETSELRREKGVDVLTLIRDPFHERMRRVRAPIIAAMTGHFAELALEVLIELRGYAESAAGRLRAGEDVVVIGAGGVGLNAIQGARIAGARRIVAVDMSEAKLEIAREFGATDAVLGTSKAPWKAALKALGKGADVVAVTVGAIPAYEQAMRYLGWGGRMVMVGMPHTGAMAQYEPVVPAYTGQQMIGSKMGDVVIRRDIPWMADLYRQGRLKLDELVSGRWSLDQINEAIADTKTGGARRNVILFEINPVNVHAGSVFCKILRDDLAKFFAAAIGVRTVEKIIHELGVRR